MFTKVADLAIQPKCAGWLRFFQQEPK